MVVFSDLFLEFSAAFTFGTAIFAVSSAPSSKTEAEAASLGFNSASDLNFVLLAGEGGAIPPPKNSNEERCPIFALDRGGAAANVVDGAFDVAVAAGTVDAAVDQDGCHMERGFMAAEARLDAPAANVAVFDGAVDQDECQIERGVKAAGFGRNFDIIKYFFYLPHRLVWAGSTPRSEVTTPFLYLTHNMSIRVVVDKVCGKKSRRYLYKVLYLS